MKAGTSVARVIATDEDIASNGLITYSIVSGNINSTFWIDPASGFIFVLEKLDVRYQSEYHLVVKASDNAHEPKYSYANVRLMIVVPENVAPKFDKSHYTLNISEATRANEIIFSGYKIFSKQSLNYELISITDDTSKYFSIDYYNGEVMLKRTLDYERCKMYEFTVKATNLVNLFDSAHVTINVMDANDNAPKWNETSYFGVISESADRGSPVMKLSSPSESLKLLAYDEDSGINSEVEFYINEPLGRKYFYVNPRNEIILLQEIDFEELSSINFTVSISDTAIENSMESEIDASVSITVTLPDPTFTMKSYSIDINESTSIGFVIFNGIQGIKQKLIYDLIAFDQDKKYLNLDANTGRVTLASSVDYEDKKDIKFLLTATNLLGGKDSASFTVNIVDINDNPPKWNKTVFSGHINEDAEPGSFVLNDLNQTLTLEAHDADVGRNGRLEYYINEPHGMEYFNLSPTSGIISLKQRISSSTKSTIIFTVSVSDLGETKLKGEPDALVIIAVDKSLKPTTTTTTTTTTTNAPPIDPCFNNPCANGATCKQINSTFRSLEERNKDHSLDTNGNVVSVSNSSSSSSSLPFTCACPLGWSGDLCTESTYICNAILKPCKNNGVCEERFSQSTCKCAPGFTGDLCEEDIDECALADRDICPPPATCFNLIGSYRCICSPYLSNGSTGLCPSAPRSPYTNALNITFDEVLFILCLLFTLVLTCCCFSCCWKFKGKDHRHHSTFSTARRDASSSLSTPVRNRTPASAYTGIEANELLYKNSPISDLNGINLKRFSKLHSTLNGVTTSLTNSPVPSSIREIPISLNNFDNIRIVGIVGDKGEIYSLAPSTDASGEVTLTAHSIAGSTVALATTLAVPTATSSNNSTATPSPIASITSAPILHSHHHHQQQQATREVHSSLQNSSIIGGSDCTITGVDDNSSAVIYLSTNTQRSQPQGQGQQQRQQQSTPLSSISSNCNTLQVNHNGHCHHQHQQTQPHSNSFTREFVTNLKKANPPPIVTVTPQVTFNDAMCSSHSGSSCSSSTIINTKIQNGRSSL